MTTKRTLLLVALGAALVTPAPPAVAANKPPACFSYTLVGIPNGARFMVGDGDTGMLSILVTKSENADTVVPAFTAGTTEPVIVRYTKIDQSKPAKVAMMLTDSAGKSRTCKRKF